MASLPPLPEDTWQLIVCRLCTHVFAVLMLDPSGEPVDLCQVCTLLAERFGQDEETPSPAAKI